MTSYRTCRRAHSSYDLARSSLRHAAAPGQHRHINAIRAGAVRVSRACWSPGAPVATWHVARPWFAGTSSPRLSRGVGVTDLTCILLPTMFKGATVLPGPAPPSSVGGTCGLSHLAYC